MGSFLKWGCVLTFVAIILAICVIAAVLTLVSDIVSTMPH